MSNWSLDPDLYLLLLFPTGRLLSPHLKPVVWIGSVAAVVSTLIDMFRQGPLDNAPTLPGVNPFGLVPVPNAVHAPFFVAWLGCILVAAASLVRRFWISRGMERQQLKWFTYAIGLLFASFLVDLSTHTWSGPLGALLLLAVVAIPVSMGIAILRYRLYDIDLLINRTLVYGVLTATLAGLYVGQVIGLQAFFRVIAGQQSELAVAISTLVIAILFNPLRHRVQSFIDRRFYRQKYDAARAMTAFQSRLRDEVDLERLTADLVQVVHDTVQPVMVSVWLRDAGSPMHEARGE